ncbi:serine-rich single-pass membrane protein 1 [Erinaceus europaeus]|uniref:Serine-rich single-pass membrane protein 1 n=1 Tax=Erinaceus europaeus TaxID=9365 RepID=A0A1S2ZTD7_ERIEU|nr:serine-rich single-pass membrane protein 1 [Erinaceus europaeus]
MGDLLSLFWEVDPPPMPLTFPIPNQDYECQKDDSCGTIGNFLLWYFVIILVLMLLSRATVWISEKKDDDSGTSTSVSKASKDSSCKRPNKSSAWNFLQIMRKEKLGHLTPVTESEVALVSAYLQQKRARRHFQFNQVNPPQHDSDTTECDSEESNSGASSWKESESEHLPSPASIKRKAAQMQRNLGNYQVKERPCLHCKAMRTNEWLTRHFLQTTSATTPMKGGIQEEHSALGSHTKFSKY